MISKLLFLEPWPSRPTDLTQSCSSCISNNFRLACQAWQY